MSALIWSTMLLTVSVAVLVAVAVVDLRSRIVPNRLVLIIAMCGVGIRLMSSPDLIWLSLLASASIVVGLGLLAHHDLMGGGDVKLIGAVALLFPLSEILPMLLSVAIAGGVLSCIYLVLRATLTRNPKALFCPSDLHEQTPNTNWGAENLLSGERLRIAAREPMPYAFAVLGGVLYRIVS